MEVHMNAISGPAQNSAITQVMTNAAVRPVRPVTSNAQRASVAQVDRFEPSGGTKPVTSSVTYGRSGKGGHADADGDGD
jgi:hypothetical protein